jgi:protein-tyrosine phosphatase
VIDTHCHLLPGLDDGPRTGSEAVQLAERLLADGIDRVLCTPHYSRMFPTRHEDAVAALRRLRDELARAGVPIELELAAEVGPAAAVTEPLEEIERRSIAGRFVVVEILPDTPAISLVTCVERLAEAGLIAIFAHPERSPDVGRHLSALDEVRGRGALVQVVAPSLLGRWGPGAEETAWRLVETGRVDLLGSDAHGARRRRPHMREAAALIAARVGRGAVHELTEDNPAAILRGVDPYRKGSAPQTAGTR